MKKKEFIEIMDKAIFNIENELIIYSCISIIVSKTQYRRNSKQRVFIKNMYADLFDCNYRTFRDKLSVYN